MLTHTIGRYPAKARPRHLDVTRSTGFHSGSTPAPIRLAPPVRSLARSAADETPVEKAQDGEGGGLRQRRGARFPWTSSRSLKRNNTTAPEQAVFAPEVAHRNTVTVAKPEKRQSPPTTPPRRVHLTKSHPSNLTPPLPRAGCKEGLMIAVMNVPKMGEGQEERRGEGGGGAAGAVGGGGGGPVMIAALASRSKPHRGSRRPPRSRAAALSVGAG